MHRAKPAITTLTALMASAGSLIPGFLEHKKIKWKEDYRDMYVTSANNEGRIGAFKARSRQHGPARTSANRTLRTKPSRSR